MTTATKTKKTKTIQEAEKMSSLLAETEEYVVLDIETTGFTPLKGGRIIELAGVRVRGGKFVEQFSQFIYPETKIYKQTIELTGITNEMLAGQPVYGQVLPKFHQFIGNSLIVAHNSIFDWDRYLVYYFGKVGLKVQNQVVDTLKLAKLYHPGQDSYKLAEVCKLHGISIENAHRAIDDTIATAHLAIAFKEKYARKEDGVQDLFGFSESEVKTPEPVLEVPKLKKIFKIRRVSYWEKDLTKKKKMQRIYVNIGIGNVYFDIPTQTWYNKDVKEPICFQSLEDQVIKSLNLKSQVDLCFYRN